MNTYGYVSGNPLSFVDPNGLSGIAIFPRPFVIPRPFAHPAQPVDPIILPNNPSDVLPDTNQPDPGGNGNDPCRGIRKMLQEHRKKLQNYLSNPYAYDNKGFLKNNPPELHQQIIDGRIRNLNNQIRDFEKQLRECEKRNNIC